MVNKPADDCFCPPLHNLEMLIVREICIYWKSGKEEQADKYELQSEGVEDKDSTTPFASYLAGFGSEEMLSPLRGLDSLVFSIGDTSMSDADSILGKRTAKYQGGDVDRHRALVLHADIQVLGKLKKGRSGAMFEERLECMEDLEATSHGAAGQLTRSHGVTRHAQ
jgi:hypothetical protein